MPERDLRNANFVFFGGSSGIGLAAAKEIGRRGANVLLVGRSAAAGAAAVAEVLAAGAGSATFFAADLSTVHGMAAAAAGVKAWRGQLHGVMHTAMSAFGTKQLTADGLELAFSLQYLARAVLDRLLADQLAASGDGRVVFISGDVPLMFMPPLDDLQFERRPWGHMKAAMGTHLLGHLHIQEATRRWSGTPVTLTAVCVGPTRTKVMADPSMPPAMRWLARLFGTTPERSAMNAVRVLTARAAADVAGAKLTKPKQYLATPIALDANLAERLWRHTTELAARASLTLP